MTEAEFLVSEDPQAMLRAMRTPWGLQLPAGGAVPQCDAQLSERQMRLFAVACCWGVSEELGKDAEQMVLWETHRARDAAGWAMGWAGDQKKPTAAQRASLLRDIIGNPFRPADVTICQQCGGHGLIGRETGRGASEGEQCPACRGLGRRYPRWRTPTVLSLAAAAYEDRPGRKCERCGGNGYTFWYPTKVDNRSPLFKREDCKTCHGTGFIEDGSLDSLTLCALADALEESGAVEPCIHCQGKGYHDTGLLRCDIHGIHDSRRKIDCVACDGNGRQTHTIVAHLRSPGPHVRGCHVIDSLLYREQTP